MEEKLSADKLKIICAEIVLGFSSCSAGKCGTFFSKHLGLLDSASVDVVREEHYQSAISKGLPTEKKQLKKLIEDGDWSKKEDFRAAELKSFASNLRFSKSKLFLKAEIDRLNTQIEEAEKEIQEITLRRLELVGLTAEAWAAKKVNEYYIYSSLYKDKELEVPFFSEEEFDELDEQELQRIISIYNDHMGRVSTQNIKRIALSGFFLNSFSLCKDNPFTFYGKPTVSLTFFQTELFTQGRHFKHIIANSKNKPPADLMDDPDAIIEWFESSQNAQAAMDKIDKNSVGGSSIVGASKEEMERLGAISDEEEGGVDLIQEAAKKGGTLNMQELMKLHGV